MTYTYVKKMMLCDNKLNKVKNKKYLNKTLTYNFLNERMNPVFCFFGLILEIIFVIYHRIINY